VSRYIITEAQMESRRRQALIIAEITEAIGRAHQKNADITVIEVVASLLATMDRWLKREMSDDAE
jgi:hypothetical protein